MAATAPLVHIVDTDNDDFGLCGAALKPLGTPDPEKDWTDQRDQANCDACEDRFDEQANDAAATPYTAEDYDADRAVERSRGIE